MPASNSTTSALFAYVCAVKGGGAASRGSATFVELSGRQPELELSTSSHVVRLTKSLLDRVGTDATGDITVVLHGETYDKADNQASNLAQRFADHGIGCAKEIHGSFATLVVDRRHDRVALITDRLNSRRIFASRVAGGFCLSAIQSDQPWESFKLDPIGVAWYLTNRIVGNSRTLLSGVSVLRRASVHEFKGDSLEASPYWQYEFLRPPTRVNKEEMAAELRTLLICAVRRRLYDEPDVFLSLSAGYDATGLLGILACDVQVPGVQCFSYEHGPPAPGSDADRSKCMAELVGYGHETVESYDGDFVQHLRDNALMGLRKNLSWYCAEEAAWKRLARHFAAAKRPAVFVGDECFGWRKYALSDFRDVLASLQIYDSDAVSWFLPLLPQQSQAELVDGLAGDLEHLQSDAARFAPGDWHDAKDYLYLDQRLGNMILPWREAFIPPGVAVRSPLLDNDILDFTRRLPPAWRLAKRLYRQTITLMYPKLFAVQRSSTSGNYYLNLREEFAANAEEVRRLIDSQSSRLDDLVPPDVLKHLLKQVLEGRATSVDGGTKGSRAGTVRDFVRRKTKRFIPSKPGLPKAEPANLLMRLLVLRISLAWDK